MSFLAGRIAAGKEGAYFLQESKHAVTRLAQKTNPKKKLPSAFAADSQSPADVLPEVLRHSLPSRIFYNAPDSSSSLSTASKWVIHKDSNNVASVSPDALNPLRAYVSLPQVTFGPKRWQLPQAEGGALASTANDLRRDKNTYVNPEKLEAAAEGLSHVGKAFAVATVIVFGGATLIFTTIAFKLELHTSGDIRTKGGDLVRSKSEKVKEQLIPVKTWAEKMSNKWHMERKEDIKEKPMVKELCKILGSNTSS